MTGHLLTRIASARLTFRGDVVAELAEDRGRSAPLLPWGTAITAASHRPPANSPRQPVSAATDSHAVEPLRDHRFWMPSRVRRFVSGTYRQTKVAASTLMAPYIQ